MKFKVGDRVELIKEPGITGIVIEIYSPNSVIVRYRGYDRFFSNYYLQKPIPEYIRKWKRKLKNDI